MDLGGIDTRRYFLAIGVFLALLFAVMAPEGSAPGGFLARLAQWGLQVGLPLALLIGVHLALHRIAAFDRLGPWIKLTVSGVVGAVLFSPLALGLDLLLGVDDWRAIETSGQLAALWWDELKGVTLPVVLVWLGINAPRVLRLDFSGRPAARPTAPDPPVTEAGFARLLPSAIGRDIVYLMSELHYLRVVTREGSALILYNLRDAIDELPAGMGFQPHRSYWVARGHVLGLSRASRPALRLTGELSVPVSRRRLAEVRAQLGG